MRNPGQTADPPVGGGIAGEVTGRERRDERRRLVERHGQPLAGDRIEIPRGVADQGDRTADDPADPLTERTGAAVPGGIGHSSEPIGEPRESPEQVVEAVSRAAPEHRHPDLLPGDRRHIGLAPRPPMDLDPIAPGGQRVVPAHPEALAATGLWRAGEPGPAAHGGEETVGPHHGACGERALFGLDPRRDKPGDGSSPTELDPDLVGALDEGLVESEPAHPEAGRPGKGAVRHHIAVEIADAAEGIALAGQEADPEGGQAGRGVRHQPLATGFLDRRPPAVEDDRGKPGEACPDRRGEPGRAAADDHDVSASFRHPPLRAASSGCGRRPSGSGPPLRRDGAR